MTFLVYSVSSARYHCIKGFYAIYLDLDETYIAIADTYWKTVV